MDKETLRQDAIIALRQLTLDAKNAIMADNLKQLSNLPDWQNAQNIGITYSMPLELPTQLIINKALEIGKNVYLPKCMPGHQLKFLPYQLNDQLVKNSFGVLEPIEQEVPTPAPIDLLIVPGLRFACNNGMRIGFGGGYYDRFLVNFVGTKISLSAKELVTEQMDWQSESFDQPVDRILIGEKNANNK
ncbi:5-formyltetrahydrofolate cyclo-ligase [Periweissella fabalis]|uniref:5-formyltetrahydrofolate cyclo-ligase n=1 Tax=Periweissella fabalis TaxID=1070421 RepID=A0A7X6N3E3_9LACO|nr:5-formyltetrahydrofolate cyclo-ligase [Periweissella fabalis]MCM0598807.1 5-formyltetrahydrofolate cyclo-ligase [Periweissella fabalis]NKZ24594.1 5-formyltetrahydrofolate cyclo-ligase [Periweissella fabalis]